jgi:hypothetical protein
MVSVQGSRVQGSILVHGVHLGSVFMRKASASSGLIQNLELNWQLLGKMSIFNPAFSRDFKRGVNLTFSLSGIIYKVVLERI